MVMVKSITTIIGNVLPVNITTNIYIYTITTQISKDTRPTSVLWQSKSIYT